MDTVLLRNLSSKLKIAPERIFREYWKLNVLKELSGEPWSSSVGFKGGTALRLAYGSPRFSDALDFSLLRVISVAKVFQWARGAAQKLGLELSDEADKRNTCLVEFRVRSDALPQPVKLKIEVSKRPLRAPKGWYELRLRQDTAADRRGPLRGDKKNSPPVVLRRGVRLFLLGGSQGFMRMPFSS